MPGVMVLSFGVMRWSGIPVPAPQIAAKDLYWSVESVADLPFQYDFQKKYTVMPAPTSTTNIRIHFCGIFSA